MALACQPGTFKDKSLLPEAVEHSVERNFSSQLRPLPEGEKADRVKTTWILASPNRTHYTCLPWVGHPLLCVSHSLSRSASVNCAAWSAVPG